MSENLSNYKIGHENQILFKGEERIIGAQSVNIQQNLGLSPLAYAGIGNKALKYIPRDAQSAGVTINSYLINKDYFLEATTGNSLHNLYILRNKSELNTAISFVSGYFNQYTCNYSIGNIPEVSTSFVALRDAGTISVGNLPADCTSQLNNISSSNIDITGQLLVPFGNNTVITLPEGIANRIQSFNLTAQANKIPVYFLGSKHPKRVDLFSSDINLNISFEVGDYEAKRLRNFPQSGISRTIVISMSDYATPGLEVCRYRFDNMNLINETYENSVNGFVNVSQQYSNRIFS